MRAAEDFVSRSGPGTTLAGSLGRGRGRLGSTLRGVNSSILVDLGSGRVGKVNGIVVFRVGLVVSNLFCRIEATPSPGPFSIVSGAVGGGRVQKTFFRLLPPFPLICLEARVYSARKCQILVLVPFLRCALG